MNIPFLRDDSAIHGQIQHVAPGVRRLLCNNPGPFTWRGTNTWIIGEGEVAVLDPGPEDAAHLEAMLRALDGEVVSHIIISHTHRDHSPGAAGLAAATGAPTYGFGPHMTAGAGGDEAFDPMIRLADGEAVATSTCRPGRSPIDPRTGRPVASSSGPQSSNSALTASASTGVVTASLIG